MWYANNPIPKSVYLIRRGRLAKLYPTLAGVRQALHETKGAWDWGPACDTYGVAGEPVEVYEITLSANNLRACRVDLNQEEIV